jgi:hypothetical protein
MRARSELLEALGGEEGCKKLSVAFYARVGIVPSRIMKSWRRVGVSSRFWIA